MNIPLYQVYTLTESVKNVQFLVDNPSVILEKRFTQLCTDYFESAYAGYKALMVGSCTRALDLISISLDLSSNDEVIMPSFNYVGVANSFAQTGAKIVFADIDAKTMNLSLSAVKKCVSPRTKVVVVMNYAGVGGDIEAISSYCKEQQLILVEDNAQGIGAFQNNKRLGSFGDLSCISFGSLKNISCGEGGVLLYKPQHEDAVQTVFNNGTNRKAFEKGKVEAYEWVELGSKFLISEFNAAILFPLLQNSNLIIQERLAKWTQLYDSLWTVQELRPSLPKHMREHRHNAHIFYLKFEDNEKRNRVMAYLQEQGISCSFHYTPLHTSIMGTNKNYPMPVDEFTSAESIRLLRLPIFNSLTKKQIEFIKRCLIDAIKLV